MHTWRLKCCRRWGGAARSMDAHADAATVVRHDGQRADHWGSKHHPPTSTTDRQAMHLASTPGTREHLGTTKCTARTLHQLPRSAHYHARPRRLDCRPKRRKERHWSASTMRYSALSADLSETNSTPSSSRSACGGNRGCTGMLGPGMRQADRLGWAAAREHELPRAAARLRWRPPRAAGGLRGSAGGTVYFWAWPPKLSPCGVSCLHPGV
jgi:hypothetical protein